MFGSPKNNKNLKTYTHMNIIVTPRSTKTTFITTVIDNNDNHTFINSK